MSLNERRVHARTTVESYLLLHHSARVKLGRLAGKEIQLT